MFSQKKIYVRLNLSPPRKGIFPFFFSIPSAHHLFFFIGFLWQKIETIYENFYTDTTPQNEFQLSAKIGKKGKEIKKIQLNSDNFLPPGGLDSTRPLCVLYFLKAGLAGGLCRLKARLTPPRPELNLLQEDQGINKEKKEKNAGEKRKICRTDEKVALKVQDFFGTAHLEKLFISLLLWEAGKQSWYWVEKVHFPPNFMPAPSVVTWPNKGKLPGNEFSEALWRPIFAKCQAIKLPDRRGGKLFETLLFATNLGGMGERGEKF